jgi:group I intron endonuclease
MLIYRAVNKINGKSYIGKTEKSLDTRREWHLASVKQHSKFAFHRALAKYGIESFEWHVIDTADNLSELNSKEQKYIELYESFGPNGYNMTAGGEGQTGWVPSAETRELWSDQRKGRVPWNKGNEYSKYKPKTQEEKDQNKIIANQKRSAALKGRKTWNTGLKDAYARTIYKVTYKDGSVKVGTRIELGLPRTTINTMFRDHCGSRKYNVMKIERI